MKFDIVKRLFKYNLENSLVRKTLNTNLKNFGWYDENNKFNYLRNMEDRVPLKYSPLSFKYTSISQTKYNDDIKYYNQNFKLKSKIDWPFDW